MEAYADGEVELSPLQYFNLAHSYWAAGSALHRASWCATFRSAPQDFLFYHSVEIYLKTFLILKGLDAETLKRFGHRTVRLYRAAQQHGLSNDVETGRVLKYLDNYSMRTRYPVTGFFEKPSTMAIWGVCFVLHDEIERHIKSLSTSNHLKIWDIPYLEE